MGYANGRIPSHALAPIPGNNAGLLKPAAYRWKACHYHSVNRGGAPLAIYDGNVGRAYRSYQRQVLAKRIYGRNAAWPGSSNHGWGLAVDLQTRAQRAAIDRYGAQFGLAKRWSDAQWEWWHIKANLSVGGAYAKPVVRDKLKGLTKEERKMADRLRYHRREYRREARTGKGRRYHRHFRFAKLWRGRVRARMNRLAYLARTDGGWKRHNRGVRYQILAKVLTGKIT